MKMTDARGIAVKCPDCPDGYVWNERGPTDKPCPTCGGEARVRVPFDALGSLTSLPLGIRKAAEVRAPKLKPGEKPKPITADCYGAHTLDWCGGATPRRKPAP